MDTNKKCWMLSFECWVKKMNQESACLRRQGIRNYDSQMRGQTSIEYALATSIMLAIAMAFLVFYEVYKGGTGRDTFQLMFHSIEYVIGMPYP